MSRNAFVLWMLGLLFAVFLQFRPLDDVDLFWQVRTGFLMLETGRLADRDQFTYTHTDDYVPPISWLAQLLFAWQLGWWGWSAVRMGAALAFAASLCVVGSTCRKEVGWFSLSLAIVLGMLVALPHSSVRPQAFGVLGFALLLALVHGSWPTWLKLTLAVPLLVLWQNLHPSVIVGGITVGAMVAIRWLRYFRTREGLAPWGLTVLLVLIGLSQFATPLGWSIIAISRQNALVARNWLQVSEWMPPWHSSVREAMATFWIALGISIMLLTRLRFRASLDDIAFFAVTTALSLSAARFALFWAVALIPIWARWIEAVKPKELFHENPSVKISYTFALPALAAGLLAMWLPTYVSVRFPGAELFAVMSEQLPWDGAYRLMSASTPRRIYNYREWGGPLIFVPSKEAVAFPAGTIGHRPPLFLMWQVAIDGRLYLFPKEEWDEYNRAALGEVPLDVLVKKHSPDAFFLRPGFHAGLIELLKQSKEWKELYSDQQCAVFVPVARALPAGADPVPNPELKYKQSRSW